MKKILLQKKMYDSGRRQILLSFRGVIKGPIKILDTVLLLIQIGDLLELGLKMLKTWP